MKELSIITETREAGGHAVQVVHVSGYIDAHSFPRFQQEILTLLNQGNNHLLIDLRNATYICSTALGLLMSVFRQVRHNAGDLVVSGLSDKIANIFNLLGISKLIPVFPNEEEALRRLSAIEAS